MEDTFTLVEQRFPAEFVRDYEILEALAVTEECETLYVRERKHKQYAVAKCYMDKALLSTSRESSILRSLVHHGLPRFICEYENENCLCVVREYVSGMPLSDMAKEHHFTEQEAVDITLQLCGILSYLHSQNPPVIHRDIKPQNIIIDNSGKVKLIDFGISRNYDVNAKKDTVFFGTQEFAPPEQYGFSQTDNRADLFSLGIVFGWLLTGETEVEKVSERLEISRFAKIYRKCTEFSPKDRYPSADKLKEALLHSCGEQRRSVRRAAAVLISILLLMTGFGVGRYTDWLAPAAKEVTFTEPAIEKAVRLQLGKNATELITQKELLTVSELYIFGNKLIAKTEQELADQADELINCNQMREGDITTLEDLAKMPNLMFLTVAMQNISDLSPLSGLKKLEALTLKNNPITDLSPLSGLEKLQTLSIFGTEVTDLSPLSSCPKLATLDIGDTPITSMEQLKRVPGIKNLFIYKNTIDTLTGAEAFTKLQYMEVSRVADGNLSPLLALPTFQGITLGEEMREAAETIKNKAAIDIMFR